MIKLCCNRSKIAEKEQNMKKRVSFVKIRSIQRFYSGLGGNSKLNFSLSIYPTIYLIFTEYFSALGMLNSGAVPGCLSVIDDY